MSVEDPDRGNFDAHVAIAVLIIVALFGIAIEAVWLLIDVLRGVSISNIPSM